jgi:DNA-directed RNA polymerase subunit M/transcription elongation factor TFIIS|tara:strand:- start:231 stop:686 length:456 start_codon:yes stop_codon:yes gene_type:complete
MIKRFLFSKLPKSIAQKASKSITTPQSARIFCSGYASCSDSLSKNSVEALIANPYLWQPEEYIKKCQQWREDIYPKNIKYEPKIQSILVCGKCKRNTVDYYEQQIRGADGNKKIYLISSFCLYSLTNFSIFSTEPMTIFANCLNCNSTWTQ